MNCVPYKNIVMFSGGKDSTAMLLIMLENNIPIDEIIFCDTGKEFPAMYSHIKEVESYISRKITVLRPSHSFDWFLSCYQIKNVDSPNYSRTGLGWCGHIFRWCTGYLKVKPMDLYLKPLNGQYYKFIGLASDELHRISRPSNQNKLYRFPLVDFGFSENTALRYCYDRGFHWNGLYDKFNRVSCYCCPLQPLSSLYLIWRDFPVLWRDIVKMDSLSHRSFRSDFTISELESRFTYRYQQLLFKFAL